MILLQKPWVWTRKPCHVFPNPWRNRDGPVIYPWQPVKLNAGWMPQNSTLFWLPILVGFCCVLWNQSGLWLLAFRNKAPRLVKSCQTLGFVWKPWVSQLTLRISRVLLVRGHVVGFGEERMCQVQISREALPYPRLKQEQLQLADASFCDFPALT